MPSIETVMYQWVNSDGSKISAMFQNDMLMQKSQLPTPQLPTAALSYKVIERKMLNQALILSVTTANLDHARAIAKELIDENSGHHMVRVFFYSIEPQPDIDGALMRFEWTKVRGLVTDYDRRTPEPSKERDLTLPEYEVLLYGDVLIPSFSRATPATTRESVARAIAKQDRLKDASFFSTRDAYQANMSASYLRSHPDAMKKGFLGSLRNGKFIAAEDLY
ncbi:hypothetical protein ACFL34_03715 [Candidatus Sumerlaeota bacterium]